MNSKLYVGQLSFSVDSSLLENFFAGVGTVVSAKVITDRDNGRSRGFGFVEMENEEQAKTAIEQLNGKELMGRTINVSLAKPQQKGFRDGDGGGRFNNRGGGGGGGGSRGFNRRGR